MKAGTKVQLIRDVDNYPDVYAKAGLTGTITRIEPDCYWVELDEPVPALSEWHNQLQIWDYSEQNADEHPSKFLRAI